jgi:S-(hydroxymethyl)glutathione dehydrogenase/alcohol dehydrogenase
MELISEQSVEGGVLTRVKHSSKVTGTSMTFAIFLPRKREELEGGCVPVLIYLSGLTCDDTNVCSKGGAFASATKSGLAMVFPDTSPRGAGVEGEDESWDFGTGAGFYVDATTEKFSKNYCMYSYVTVELPALLAKEYPFLSKKAVGITGHSMGGHGALTIAFKNPGIYASVSAFAPISNPSTCPWGEKAFGGYLGPDKAAWADYDATELMKAKGPFPFDDILIDVGLDDNFYKQKQLQPENLQAAAADKKQKLTLRMQPGFDHSYYFVSSFMEDHIAFHAKRLVGLAREESLSSVLARDEAILKAVEGMAGKPIKCKAMVAFAPKEDLVEEEIWVAPPKAGEVRVKVCANALCHTDVYTQSGQDPEGLFPSILGHEAGAVVVDVGEGVTSVVPGDHVVPAYTPQCCKPTCIFCQSSKTNLCPAIRGTQGKGVMPDGTSRFSLVRDGSTVYHFMGCSTFAEYTVLAEISCAKVPKEADLSEICLFGCGVSTGLGAVWNTTKVEPNSSVAVFGLGAVGLSVVQGAKMAGASRIFCIDINASKFDMARKLGGTDFVNPLDPAWEGKPIQQVLVGLSPTGFGIDYTFDCTGNVNVMRSALECAHRGWGKSCVIGVAASGHELSFRPFQVVTGRVVMGTAFGGWKSREAIPKLVNMMMAGELPIKHFITDTLQGVEKTNEAIHILEGGQCLRCVVKY